MENFLKENTNVKTFKSVNTIKQLKFSFEEQQENNKNSFTLNKQNITTDLMKRVNENKLIVYDKNLVRTDPKLQTIDKFVIKNGNVNDNIPSQLLKKSSSILNTVENNDYEIENNEEIDSKIEHIIQILLSEEANSVNTGKILI